MTVDQLIAQVAREHNITPEHARAEMEKALMAAQQSKNPATQAKWAAIPKKGKFVTLDEFLIIISTLGQYYRS